MLTDQEIRSYLEVECLGMLSIISSREERIKTLRNSLLDTPAGQLLLVAQRKEDVFGGHVGIGYQPKNWDYHVVERILLGIHQPPGIRIEKGDFILTTSAWTEAAHLKIVNEGEIRLSWNIDGFHNKLTFLGSILYTKNPVYSRSDRHGGPPLALEILVGDQAVREWFGKYGWRLREDITEAIVRLGKESVLIPNEDGR